MRLADHFSIEPDHFSVERDVTAQVHLNFINNGASTFEEFHQHPETLVRVVEIDLWACVILVDRSTSIVLINDAFECQQTAALELLYELVIVFVSFRQ